MLLPNRQRPDRLTQLLFDSKETTHFSFKANSSREQQAYIAGGGKEGTEGGWGDVIAHLFFLLSLTTAEEQRSKRDSGREDGEEAGGQQTER